MFYPRGRVAKHDKFVRLSRQDHRGSIGRGKWSILKIITKAYLLLRQNESIRDSVFVHLSSWESQSWISANVLSIKKRYIIFNSTFLFNLHFKSKGMRCIIIMILGLVIPVLAQSQNKKNVVFILVDDLGWKDLAYAGSPLYHTPHIDDLASTSVIFNQAYAAHPVCSPSRASILTGKNPIRIGISDWIPGSDPKDRRLLGPEDLHQLPLEEVTMAEILKENGYTTFFAGKWHLGNGRYTPENQGFDINIGGIDKGSPPGGYYTPYKNPKLPDGPEGEYLTDRLTTETIDFITENHDQPFLAYLSFYTVHTPIQANKEFRPLYDQIQVPDKRIPLGEGESLLYQNNLDYASMVTAMDKNVGRIVNNLKELDLWDNTILIFTSDNGGLSTLYPGRDIPTSTFPSRGGKGWEYEGGIRIPLVIHDPDQKSGSIRNEPAVHMDLLPTLLASLEIQYTPPLPFDGINLFDENFSKNGSRKTLFWHFPHYHGSGWKPGSALRSGEWKYIYTYEDEKSELYNLDSDPEESVNLSTRFPDRTMDMKKKLFDLIDESNGKYPVQNPDW